MFKIFTVFTAIFFDVEPEVPTHKNSINISSPEEEIVIEYVPPDSAF